MLEKQIVKVNNAITHFFRNKKVDAKHILLLIPHCLQEAACTCNIITDINRCQRCGSCKIADLIDLKDKYGIQCAIASGGRMAVGLTRQESVHAVVAVACEKELSEGILATLPKRVMAVQNLHPHGFCKNTDVDISAVEKAILEFLK